MTAVGIESSINWCALLPTAASVYKRLTELSEHYEFHAQPNLFVNVIQM